MIQKIKNLSKETLIYGTSTMVGRFLNFILVPFYTNFIPPAEYGIIANIFAYIAILNVFFSLGLESGFFRFSAFQEIGSKKENFSLPFLTVFFNSLILCAVLFFFPSAFSGIFSVTPENFDLIKYTALILFFDAIVLVPFANLRLQHKPRKFSIIKLINIVVNVALNFILIIGFNMGIEAILISNLAASIVTFIVLLPEIFANLEIKFNKELFIELLKFSIPYIPAGISANIIQVIDRPMLVYLTDDTTAGIYTANYKLGIIMMIFVTMFDFAWRPFFLNNAKDENAKLLFSKVMTLFILVGAFICMITTLFLNDIILIFGQSYRSGLEIVPIILFAYLLNGVYINLMPGIYFKKKTKYLPLITGIAATVNVISNFILIPEYGMMGAAYSTFLSYLLMVIGIYMVAQKYYKINYEYFKISVIFLSLIFIMLFWFYSPNLNLVIKLLVIAGYIGIVFVFKVLNVHTIVKLIRSKGV